MPTPTKKRIKAVQQAEIELQTLTKQLQREYYLAVARVVASAINTDGDTITAVAGNNVFVNAWKRLIGRGINSFLIEKFKYLEGLQAQYYSKFDTDFLDFDQIQKAVENGLKVNLQAFANSYNDSLVVAGQVRAQVLALITQGLSAGEIADKLDGIMNGTNTALGIVENYNFYQIRVQDTFAEYDRRLSNEYASQLKLNYFIYQGGEIKTTRQFCEERNGNVYTREEGEAFNLLDWEGKKVGHRFFIDCGGYNCRHYLDWISYELAVQLRPDIKKSIYDGI